MYNKILLLLSSCMLASCITFQASVNDGWVTLFNGKDLENWDTTGDANWNLFGDLVQADMGNGMLVSKESYGDFQLKLEFWVDKDSNSGVFIRCGDSENINPTNCYEVNIFDSRPDQSGRTGAVVGVSPPAVKIDSEGHWNSYQIMADGSHLVIKLNGTTTVDAHDDRLKDGPFALQYGSGAVKFRNVRIQRL